MKRNRTRMTMLILVLSMALSACGSTSSTSSTSTAETGSTPVAGTSSTSAATGEAHRHSPFLVGFSLPGSIPSVVEIDQAATATIQRAGGTVATRNADLNPNQQIADIRGLIEQHAKVIIVGAAIIPQGLLPVLRQAVEAGIKVFAWEWDYSNKSLAGGAPPPPIQGQVVANEPLMGEEIAKAIHQATGGHGRTIYVGYPNPVPGLNALYAGFSAETKALHDQLLAEVFNTTGDTSGCQSAVQNALARFPDANAIVTFDPDAALGCIAAVKASGKAVPVYVGGLATGFAAEIKSGAAALGFEAGGVEGGVDLGKLAIEAATGAPASNWNRTIVVPPVAYTRQTIGNWIPTSEQLAKVVG